MSTFRRPKPEAAFLYSLPRRELQALCKQYRIAANKTNNAMADALSAHVPFEGGNSSKGAVGLNSLGIAKTTIMKLKLEKRTELPETSLATLIASGKAKASPVKPRGEKPNVFPDRQKDSSFGLPKITPIKRGLKRSLPTLPEEKSNNVHAETRGSSPKARGLTPRKRAGATFAVASTRGRDTLPPVSFSALLSTPTKATGQPPVTIINLDTTSGKSARKTKSRLRSQQKDQEEEDQEEGHEDKEPITSKAAVLPVPKAVGRRVTFANNLVDYKVIGSRDPPEQVPQEEEDDQEISNTGIEFKDSALHMELLGGIRSHSTPEEVEEEEEQDDEEDEDEEAVVVDTKGDEETETVFEYRNLALHKELLGSQIHKGEDEPEEDVRQISEASEAKTDGSSSPQMMMGGSESDEDEDVACMGSPPSALDLSHEDTHVNSAELEVCYKDSPVGTSSYGKLDVVEEEFDDEVQVLEVHECIDLIHTKKELAVVLTPCNDKEIIGCSNNYHIDEEADLDRRFTPNHRGFGELECGEEEVPTSSGPSNAQNLDEEASRKESGNHHHLAETKMNHPLVVATSSSGGDISNNNRLIAPLDKIQSNIESTLAKANQILGKLSMWRVDAEKKMAEGYWEPKFSTVIEGISTTVSKVEEQQPVEFAATIPVQEEPRVERDLPSAKKARISPKATSSPKKKDLDVCEDVVVVAEGEMPSAKKARISTTTDALPGVDKENQTHKGLEETTSSKQISDHGKDKKKAKKKEALKDRSMNVLHPTNNETKENFGQNDTSSRTQRAQFRKDKQINIAKASRGLRPQRTRSTAH